MTAIRQARVETSRFLAELLEFAQTRLLEYARLVAERGCERDEDDDDDDFGDGSGGLMGSCVWELQERGCVIFIRCVRASAADLLAGCHSVIFFVMHADHCTLSVSPQLREGML